MIALSIDEFYRYRYDLASLNSHLNLFNFVDLTYIFATDQSFMIDKRFLFRLGM